MQSYVIIMGVILKQTKNHTLEKSLIYIIKCSPVTN